MNIHSMFLLRNMNGLKIINHSKDRYDNDWHGGLIQNQIYGSIYSNFFFPDKSNL